MEAELAKYAASDPKHLEKARCVFRFRTQHQAGRLHDCSRPVSRRNRACAAQVLSTTKAAHDACNRWTDNVFLLRQYLEKQFGRGDSVDGLFKSHGASCCVTMSVSFALKQALRGSCDQLTGEVRSYLSSDVDEDFDYLPPLADITAHGNLKGRAPPPPKVKGGAKRKAGET